MSRIYCSYDQANPKVWVLEKEYTRATSIGVIAISRRGWRRGLERWCRRRWSVPAPDHQRGRSVMDVQLSLPFSLVNQQQANAARREARVSGSRIYRGLPCKRCGLAERLTKTNRCVSCYNNYQRLYQPKWRANNVGVTQRAIRGYYHRNAAKESARKLAFKLANPEKALWLSAKTRATKNGIEFNIDVEDIIIPEICPVLGIQLKRNTGGVSGGIASPTIDRHDPTKGYVKGNISVVSLRANMLKANATIDEIEAVLHYMKRKTDGVNDG